MFINNPDGQKMDIAKVKRIVVSTAAVASILLGASAASAQSDERLKKVVSEVNQANEYAQASQGRVDSIADATAGLFNDYKSVLKTNAGLRAYNAQQRRVIANQEEEIAKINASIGQIDEVKRQMTPLMLEMIDNLEEFINSDIPFQKQERLDRITSLRNVMDDPNVNDPERFRLVLEAYKTEVSYGNKLAAFEDQLDSGKAVNFVRLGRIGFYYQSLDGKDTGAWNNETKSWETLGAEYNTPIKNLLKMARRQTPLNTLVLPVAAPKG